MTEQEVENVDLFSAGSRAIGRFQTNRELQRHLRRNMLRMAVLMEVHMFLNRFRPPEKLKLPPP